MKTVLWPMYLNSFSFLTPKRFSIRLGTKFVLLLAVIFLSACSSKENVAKNEGPVAIALRSQLNEWQGTPYRYGGTTKQGIDCSAFVQITYKKIFRANLPRSTKEQSRLGKKVSPNQHKAGDLIFFRTEGSSTINHVGIYAENNTFIHASTSKGVTRSNLNNDYWRKNYVYSRRLIK